MKQMILAAVVGTAAAFAPHAALAFTVENHGAIQSGGASAKANAGPSAGYLDMDASSLMPPVGEPIGSSSFDFSPSSYNNGFAAQPTRGGSVGPSWLYPPGR